MDVYWIPIILGTGFFLMMGSMAYFSSKSKSDRARYQAEVQARLIEKFGTGPEFVTFLQSQQGREFMGNIEAAPKFYARDRILGGLRKAIIVGFLGVAFILIPLLHAGNWEMMIPGILLLCLGLGFFVSAVVSAKLSKQWGLFEEHNVPVSQNAIQPPTQS